MNRLKVNDDKSEFIIIGTNSALSRVKTTALRVGTRTIQASSFVRNIGCYFDRNMKMNEQVKHTCKSAWFHLYNISKIRRFLTCEQVKSIVHAYVTSKLDFNNVLLTGAPDLLLKKLQLIQNAAARLITGSKRQEHITPILKMLHWLPMRKRILFKVLLLTYKAINGCGPKYLKELLDLYQPTRCLRSATDPLLLTVPKSRLKTFGDRSFAVFAPFHWNQLPFHIRSSTNVNNFKRNLKTHLFAS